MNLIAKMRKVFIDEPRARADSLRRRVVEAVEEKDFERVTRLERAGQYYQEVKEHGDSCSCGGEIDKLYRLEPSIWRGRCFQCGEQYTVIIFERGGQYANQNSY